jgi:cobalt/nickel transport system ATP-binding protein
VDLIAKLLNVSYAYPDGTKAVKNVSLELRRGNVICITGPNGSGKSTLLMILAALIFPQEGEVYLFGKKIDKKNASEVRKKIGFLFQNPDDMLFNPSVIEEISFGLIAKGVNREISNNLALEEMKKLKIENLAYKVPHRLSFGQRRLVSLASILVTDPSLLLLDEPTSNLDEKNRELIIERLMEFFGNRKDDWGAAIATHDNELIYICNEFFYMSEGELSRI